MVATPAYDATTPPASCGAHTGLAALPKGARRKLHADGTYTPILLVHGGNPGMWAEPINLSTLNIAPRVTSSLLGNLQESPAAVCAIDYSNECRSSIRPPSRTAA